MADTNLVLDLNLTDPTYAHLANLGSRLDALMNKPIVQTDDNVAGTLDELYGIVRHRKKAEILAPRASS